MICGTLVTYDVAFTSWFYMYLIICINKQCLYILCITDICLLSFENIFCKDMAAWWIWKNSSLVIYCGHPLSVVWHPNSLSHLTWCFNQNKKRNWSLLDKINLRQYTHSRNYRIFSGLHCTLKGIEILVICKGERYILLGKKSCFSQCFRVESYFQTKISCSMKKTCWIRKTL